LSHLTRRRPLPVLWERECVLGHYWRVRCKGWPNKAITNLTGYDGCHAQRTMCRKHSFSAQCLCLSFLSSNVDPTLVRTPSGSCLPSGSGSRRAVVITPRLSPLSVHTYDASSRLRHHVPFRYAEELLTMWVLSQSLHQFTSFTSHGLVGVQ
jgi:hypothetical protein